MYKYVLWDGCSDLAAVKTAKALDKNQMCVGVYIVQHDVPRYGAGGKVHL